MRTVRLWLPALALFVLSACPPAKKTELLELTPSALALSVGEPRTVSASLVVVEDGIRQPAVGATWTSSDEAVAKVTVNADGTATVTGVGAGSATVTASLRTATATVSVIVTARPRTLDRIELEPSAPSLAKGTSLQLTATGIFSDATREDLTTQVTWRSSAESVLVVTQGGLVNGLEAGTATVTVSLGNAFGNVTVTVTAASLARLEVTPPRVTVARGFSQAMAATGVFTDGTTQDLTTQVTWSTADAAVATVSAAGVVTGVGGGETAVRATRDGVTGEAVVTVSSAALSAIEVAPAAPSLSRGTTQQLTATARFSDGSTQDITQLATWSSASPGVASVSNAAGERGLVTARAQGTAVVSATFTEVTGSTTVTVTSATLTRIDVAPMTATIAAGRTRAFTATGVYSDGATADLTSLATWSSSDPAKATISNAQGSYGLARGLGVGDVTITATRGGISGTATLTVTAAELVSIAVTPTGVSLPVGLTRDFTATGTFSDGSTQDITTQVTWETTNMTATSISNAAGTQGRLTALATGGTTVRAVSGGIVGSTAVTIIAAQLVSIAVTAASTSLRRGDTLQLTATGTYTDASTANITDTVTWSSSATGTLTVSNAAGTKGLATGVAVGTATATATLGAVSGALNLNVTPPDLVSIAVTPANPSVTVGGTQAFTATGTYSDTTTQDLTATATWASSDQTKATIAATGVATAVAAGTTTISATVDAISGSTTLTVTVPTIVSIAVTPPMPSVAKGRTQAFTATATYSDSTTGDVTASVTWESSDESKVTIAPTGVATAVAEGSSTITARSGSVTGTATMTVTPAVLESLTVTGVTTLAIGNGAFFVATGTMSDGTTPNLTSSVTWSSSDDLVATVSDAAGTKGAVAGLAHGNVTITATQGAVSANLNVRVRARNAPAQTRCGPGLVISQVYGGGGNSGATYRQDFVELHNAGPGPVSLTGLSIQYTSGTGTSWSNKTDLPSVTLQPGDFFLVRQAAGTGGTTDVPFDFEGTIAMSATAGKVALVNGTTPLTGACPTTGVIDFVGFGASTPSCTEGNGTAAPGNTTAVHRLVSGCQDTNSNPTDFVVLAPAPRTLATPGILCDCDVTDSDRAEEVDYCALQFPASLSPTAGAVTDAIYTRVFQDMVTQPAGADPRIRAQVGFGPSMTSPATTAGWSWWPTRFNVQVGNDDEYEGRFVAPVTGTYSYTGRVSLDGVNWTSCDLNGAGRNMGLSLETSQLGVMNVP
jgi:uncharacterized protein YjdB